MPLELGLGPSRHAEAGFEGSGGGSWRWLSSL